MDEKIPEFYIGTAANVSSEGVRILFDGQTEATEKRYKILNTGVQVASGDRVIVAKISGSYVVLGKISYEQSGGGITVDDALSTTSENPVQNKVITNTLNDKVSKSGDTMTGDLVMNASDVVSDSSVYTVGTTPSKNYNDRHIYFRDKLKTIFGRLQSVFMADSRVGLQMVAERTLNNVLVQNILGIYVDESGTKRVDVSSQEEWRKALGLGTNGAFPIPVAQGGTGATNASDALAALGAASKSAINSAHIYFSPSELGLSGTPTMKAIVDAMPNHSVGCFQNGDIDQTALTQPFGDDVSVVIIFKVMQYRSLAFGGRAYNSISNNASRYAFASYDGNAWKGWFAIVKEQELRYQPNDTYVSTKSHLLYGIIAGGSTNFVCDVVLPKTLENITGVTVTAMSGQIKGVLGSVDNLSQNTSFLSSPYSATAEKLDYNKIRITVHKSSAFANTTNNSPATYWGSISLKFT